jgi:hypothetical protein
MNNEVMTQQSVLDGAEIRFALHGPDGVWLFFNQDTVSFRDLRLTTWEDVMAVHPFIPDVWRNSPIGWAAEFVAGTWNENQPEN